ncbi:MAG: hypothetical protein DRO88_11155 [Promethearchaeia archaeon]|nr:MAG: hypothetical protein DRO88_11155 [Candidatus Lokiarchaeia archaeon]
MSIIPSPDVPQCLFAIIKCPKVTQNKINMKCQSHLICSCFLIKNLGQLTKFTPEIFFPDFAKSFLILF